ncbi:DUF397 domain-containing protein [Streptomyces sp. NPDC048611]|uniref:DUF397 domain-containing protein n=1 Tax=Streptomyces sp. NPDC048611 TaxID=3155635 RepID=UPI0034494F11
MSNEPTWHKSSYSSASSDNCVEVADNLVTAVLVRDTKQNGQGPVLAVSPSAWAAFTDFAKESAV